MLFITDGIVPGTYGSVRKLYYHGRKPRLTTESLPLQSVLLKEVTHGKEEQVVVGNSRYPASAISSVSGKGAGKILLA